MSNRTCSHCGADVPLQKPGAIGLRPCPGCGRPLSVRSRSVDDSSDESASTVNNLAPTAESESVVEPVPSIVSVTEGQAIDDRSTAEIRRRPGWLKSVRRALLGIVAVTVICLMPLVGGFYFLSNLGVPLEDNLARIGKAGGEYTRQNQGLLLHASIGPKKESGLSWRVHLLPYLGDPQLVKLHAQFHLNEPWDSPHNLTLVGLMPSVYRTPDVHGIGETSIHLFTGAGTPLGEDQPNRLIDLVDLPSKTIMVIVAGADAATEWTRPGGRRITNDPIVNLERSDPNPIPTVMMDGSVHYLPYDIDPKFALILIRYENGSFSRDLKTFLASPAAKRAIPSPIPPGSQVATQRIPNPNAKKSWMDRMRN